MFASMYTSSEGSGETATCAGSPKPSLFAYAISSHASWADLFILSVAHSYMPSSNDCCLAVIGSLVKEQTGRLFSKRKRFRTVFLKAYTTIARPKLKKNQCAYCIQNVRPSVTVISYRNSSEIKSLIIFIVDCFSKIDETFAICMPLQNLSEIIVCKILKSKSCRTLKWIFTFFPNASVIELYSMNGIIPHFMFVKALKLPCNWLLSLAPGIQPRC